MGYVQRPSGEIAFDQDEHAQATIRRVFELSERFRTVGRVMRYLVDHNVCMPVRVAGGARKGELEWHRVNGISLHNLFANPIYAGAYVYGLRPTDPRQQKPGRPSTGRRSAHHKPSSDCWGIALTLRAQAHSSRPGRPSRCCSGAALRDDADI